MKVTVAIVNAFVDAEMDTENGGNPAGVVVGADHLSSEQKLAIAREVGLSETAFVSESDSAGFKLDFFTPEKQIAHCGHATIATFSHLSQLGLVTDGKTSKETIDGNRDIEVAGDFAYMGQLQPSYHEAELSKQKLAAMLGLSEDRLLAEARIVNTGNAFLVLGVKSIADLEALQPDNQAIKAISREYDLIGFYVFTTETNLPGRDASARMFAPFYGIPEESATGMAAGPLACYLHDLLGANQDTFYIEQGYAMTPKAPSCIQVVLSRQENNIMGLKAGGVGKPSRTVEVDI